MYINTGDAWSSLIVRPLAVEENAVKNFFVQLFFVVYMIMVSVVLINCVIAVLLGGYICIHMCDVIVYICCAYMYIHLV